jgi:hypothetical protein
VVVDVTGRLLGLNTARLGEGFYLALPADAARATRTLEVQLVRGADELTVQVSFPEPPGE